MLAKLIGIPNPVSVNMFHTYYFNIPIYRLVQWYEIVHAYTSYDKGNYTSKFVTKNRISKNEHISQFYCILSLNNINIWRN